MANSNEKAVAVVEQNAELAMTFTPEQVNTIRMTVAKGATDTEMSMFLHLAQKFGLDPFAKEIWFIKAGGQPVIMTGHDGYLKIANRNPNFDGLVGDVVYQGDIFRRVNGEVQHVYGHGDRGDPVGAYALVYKKNTRFPVYFYAPMGNYFKNTPVWRQYKHAMIMKVAENMAIKRAFSLSGLTSREEMDANPMGDEPVVQQQAEPFVANTQGSSEVVEAQVVDSELKKPTFAEHKKAVWKAYLTKCGGDKERAQREIQAVVGDKAYHDINEQDVALLETMPNFDSAPDMPETANAANVQEAV